MRYCDNCGKQIESTAKFCPHCGKGTGIRQFDGNGFSAADGTGGIQPECGMGDMNPPDKASAARTVSMDYSEKIGRITASEDRTADYAADDIAGNKAYAVLSYISFFAFLPILMGSKSAFARFHANQGLVLFIAEFVFGVLKTTVFGLSVFSHMEIMSFVSSALGIFNLVFFVLSVYGIIHAAKGEAKELPIFGKVKLLQ